MSRSIRPGVYMSMTNIGKDAIIFAVKPGQSGGDTPAPGPEPSKFILLKDSSGMLLKTSDGYYLAVKN